ncbi:MAG: alpha/beta hydrolase [Methylophilaceae bacterium]
MLEHITFESAPNPQHSIIWLHGLGADGGDFLPIAQELGLEKPVRFIFPHAPTMPVTINGGYVMRTWYDIFSLEIGSPQDDAGIRRSQAEIEMLIAQEVARGVTSENILLAGFSQGGAIVLHTALRHPQKLAGVLALSTYLPLHATVESERSVANTDIPIFMAHGHFDTVIKPEIAIASKNKLASMGYFVDWQEYAMAHSVCEDEILHMRRFIMANL